MGTVSAVEALLLSLAGGEGAHAEAVAEHEHIAAEERRAAAR